MSEARQRGVGGSKPPKQSNGEEDLDDAVLEAKRLLARRVKAEDSAISWLDIARSIVFLILASSAVSWLVTRESFVWGLQRPNFTRFDVLKSWLVSSTPSKFYAMCHLSILWPYTPAKTRYPERPYPAHR